MELKSPLMREREAFIRGGWKYRFMLECFIMKKQFGISYSEAFSIMIDEGIM